MGEGNITINMNYVGNLSDAIIEIVANKDFDLRINESDVALERGFLAFYFITLRRQSL